MVSDELRTDEDFSYLLSFLPENWRLQAKILGALRRCRGIPNPNILLRLLLIHIADGCSLRETALRASKGGLVNISDVAIMGRLRASGRWFQWMSTELMKKWVIRQPASVYGEKWNVRIIDGTRVKEPGPTGSSWCIHYSIGLPSLQCDELIVLDKHGNGETFSRFKVKKGDLLIGDRVYGVRPGMYHVVSNGGHVLARFSKHLLPLVTKEDKEFDLLHHLLTLNDKEIGDWDVCFKEGKHRVEGRVCAIKKSRQATDAAIKKIRRAEQKHGFSSTAETIETAGYFFVFTTVNREELSRANVLEIYRGRWQIEMVFKRLKSVLALGHLRKADYQSALSWIQGKIFVAFIVESLIAAGETFFPWGFPIPQSER